MTNNEKYLRNQLSVLTANWSHTDWRKVRNIDYFFSDYLPTEAGLQHKIERIRYYNAHGVIMPYSRMYIEDQIEKIEKKKLEVSSILTRNGKEKPPKSEDDEPFQ